MLYQALCWGVWEPLPLLLVLQAELAVWARRWTALGLLDLRRGGGRRRDAEGRMLVGGGQRKRNRVLGGK
ncbi:hypothetical protein GUJ93_ZPchr0011g28645 [Zizania palustris]|uniref:Uncharacterized protein n=1 Tax=Zizania palustris TaxID=103762 RepID=A0A8J5WIS3_ZIZPA|nr:hypothetical protein GUJ93_ZPchr0011g28645 [Zizania palustris]